MRSRNEVHRPTPISQAAVRRAPFVGEERLQLGGRSPRRAATPAQDADHCAGRGSAGGPSPSSSRNARSRGRSRLPRGAGTAWGRLLGSGADHCNRASISASPSTERGDPRVRGDQNASSPTRPSIGGSSPRTQGTAVGALELSLGLEVIPACAGRRDGCGRRCACRGGSSPRARGTRLVTRLVRRVVAR